MMMTMMTIWWCHTNQKRKHVRRATCLCKSCGSKATFFGPRGGVAHLEIKECGRGSPAPPHSLFYNIIKHMHDDEDGWMDGWTDWWVIYDPPDKEFGRGSWADSLKHCGATENVPRRTNKELGRGSPPAPPSLRCRTTVLLGVLLFLRLRHRIHYLMPW